MPHPTTSPDPASRILVGTHDIALDEELIAVRGVVVEGQRVIRPRGWRKGEKLIGTRVVRL